MPGNGSTSAMLTGNMLNAQPVNNMPAFLTESLPANTPANIPPASPPAARAP